LYAISLYIKTAYGGQKTKMRSLQATQNLIPPKKTFGLASAKPNKK
jgi:hypothetical protein